MNKNGIDDIHCFVEVVHHGKWESADEWIDADTVRNPFYENKNTPLFAALANVNNKPGECWIKPITLPKGMPKNVSPEVRRAIERAKGHSHSYLTLRELLNYDWYRKITRYTKPFVWSDRLEYYCLSFLAQLHRLWKIGPPDNVRIVFFFSG